MGEASLELLEFYFARTFWNARSTPSRVVCRKPEAFCAGIDTPGHSRHMPRGHTPHMRKSLSRLIIAAREQRPGGKDQRPWGDSLIRPTY
jgi:hypothetical protein